MSSSTIHNPQSPNTDRYSDNEVLVKVDGVSKKFCRDLKKSLWYGMCDVASEPFFPSVKNPTVWNKNSCPTAAS